MGSNSEIPGSMFLAIGNRMLRIVEIITCGLVVHARSGADAGVHQENWKILNLPFLPFLACGKSKKYTFSK
jgi:hypothetical protein